MKISIARLVLCALMTFSGSVAFGQTDTSTFTMTVPVELIITAPAATASATHDQTNNDQDFGTQTWTVEGNNATGVTVVFETGTPFNHASVSGASRDAKLTLAAPSTTTGPGTWTVASTGIDTTSYSTSDDVASVSVASDGPGTAQLNLTVSFITETFGLFPAGDYSTTVTGTITANQ